MIAAIWGLFAVLLSLWTGAVWLATALTRWASMALEDSTRLEAIHLPSVADQIPPWLTAWIPPDVLHDLMAKAQWVTQLFEASLPWAGTAVGWLIPIAWVGWFLVTILLVATAVVLHVGVRRSRLHFPARAG